jgi:hypothetical protein
MSLAQPRRRTRGWRASSVGATALAIAATSALVPGSQSALADAHSVTSRFHAGDGKTYTVTNHLKPQARTREGQRRKEWLLVWAGDENAADTAVRDVKGLPGSLSLDLNQTIDKVRNALPGPDFLAVIDATKGSPSYGKVVNTATVGPLVENEPHHMQYTWHKGDEIYAGGLYSAATYMFDVKRLPEVRLTGVSLPTQTLCGSVPDAFWTLKDHTAYGTYMGGPVVPGPCRYSDGQVRLGNGFAGSPGEVVRFDPTGRKLVEAPAATTSGEDPKQCADLPRLSAPTCANPHGIQLREDLNRMVTSDYAEPRNIILDPVKAPSPYLRRPTVRIWDISNRDRPKVVNVSYLPEGPRSAAGDPLHTENRAVMEATVTNQPGHRGAFAETMDGGAIFYTPDITSAHPRWREVFDDTQAQHKITPDSGSAAGDLGGWLQTSPDDHYLYHSVIGRKAGTLGPNDKGSPPMVFALDISPLVGSGASPRCSITTKAEIDSGGTAADCPKLVSTLPISDNTSGGPHWGSLDNFKIGPDGFYHETARPDRMAISNYFVARTGIDGNHRVCMVTIGDDGRLTLDKTFRDENEGTPCVDFNRKYWPHGAFGNAKPHAVLFVTADDDVR